MVNDHWSCPERELFNRGFPEIAMLQFGHSRGVGALQNGETPEMKVPVGHVYIKALALETWHSQGILEKPG